MKNIFSEGERKILSLLLLCTFILFFWLLIEPPSGNITSKGQEFSIFSNETIKTADKMDNFKFALGEFLGKVKEILKK